MKLHAYFLLALISFCAPALSAQQSRNYGTEKATALYEDANALLKSQKYAEAKVLFERVVATGDAMYVEPARKQISFINGVMAKGTKQSPVFTISDDNIELAYLGGTYPVVVNGAESWSVEPKNYDDWCSVEVDRRKNKIIINVSPNESTQERDALLTVTTKRGEKKTIRVRNAAAPEVLRSSAQSLTFTPEGETSVVDIDANTAWELSDVPEWLSAIKGVRDIQFTAAPNDVNRDRIAQVKVETPNKNEITINIIQSAALDSLAFSKNNLHFGPEGGDEYIKVLTDADDWRFGDFPHWCQLSRIDNNTILVHCTPNQPIGIPREASVNVTTGTQTLGVNVSQDMKPIVNIIPTDGIGGRPISFGFSAGYVMPMISTGASSNPILSPVNYTQGVSTKTTDYKTSGGFNIGAFVDIRMYKNLYLNACLDLIYYKYRHEFDGDMKLVLPLTSNYYLKGDGFGSFKEDYTMINLDIPILASYRIPLTSKSHLRINAGPVLSVGLSSKLDLSGRTNSETLRKYSITNGIMTDDRYDNGIYKSHINYSGSFDLYTDMATLSRASSYDNGAPAVSNDKMDAVPFNRFNLGLRFGVGYEFMGISLSVHYQWMVSNLANKNFWEGNRWTILQSNDEYRMRGYTQRNNLLMVTLGYTFRY